jgi:hypothetical protein
MRVKAEMVLKNLFIASEVFIPLGLEAISEAG